MPVSVSVVRPLLCRLKSQPVALFAAQSAASFPLILQWAGIQLNSTIASMSRRRLVRVLTCLRMLWLGPLLFGASTLRSVSARILVAVHGEM